MTSFSLTSALKNLAATAAIIAAPLVANAQSLYDAPPTPTSAFIRFIGSDVTQDLTWRGQHISFGDYQEGAYIAIESSEIETDAGNYMTVVATPEGASIDLDEVAREQGKVALQMLNLTDTSVSLTTADDKIMILEATSPNALSARQINPLAFSVKVVGEDGALGTLDLNIKRGGNPIIVVRMDGSLVVFNSSLAGSANQ